MATKLSLLLVAIALSAAGCGGGSENGDEAARTEPATTSPEASEPITVELHEVNESGQSGTATLVQGKVGSIETFKVSLEIEPALDLPQMAHVHRVTCAEYAKIKGIDKQILTVHSPLADIRDGKAEASTVPGSVATGEFSINVHEPESPFPAVACGDIPKLPE
jgi:hypothetical protein